MTDAMPDETSGHHPEDGRKSRRLRIPRIDFVTLMLVLLAAIILVFVTAELWLPHMGN